MIVLDLFIRRPQKAYIKRAKRKAKAAPAVSALLLGLKAAITLFKIDDRY